MFSPKIPFELVSEPELGQPWVSSGLKQKGACYSHWSFSYTYRSLVVQFNNSCQPIKKKVHNSCLWQPKTKYIYPFSNSILIFQAWLLFWDGSRCCKRMITKISDTYIKKFLCCQHFYIFNSISCYILNGPLFLFFWVYFW